MRRGLARTATVACCLALFGASAAHVRLVTQGGTPVFWDEEDSVSVVIQSSGSDNVPDASDEIAVRLAIEAWNLATGTTAHLVEDTDPTQQARTDWESDSIHLIRFDEDDSSGYFPGKSKIVAVTPVWFFSNGRITDADILFNGSEYTFTTSGQPGRFDVQDVAAHELGHLLGLDHSGVAGSSLFPYVDPDVILHRSLALDDQGGLRDAYPAQAFGTVQGVIRRQSDETGVSGAHVVALDASGRTAGAVLAGESGAFTLRGLAAGTYTVYAAPLDGPVKASNVSDFYTIHTDFETGTYATSATVTAGASTGLGPLLVGADVSVILGRSTDPLPLRAVAGEATTLTLSGSDLVFGSTLVPSDPEVSVTPVHWGGIFVTFQVHVPAGAAPGHVDLRVVTPGGDAAVLPAALEITPPAPTVSAVTPPFGSAAGSTQIVLTGTGFRPGARVVLGDRAYADGEGGTAVLSDTEIELTTLPTVTGQHDVVVIDETGVEGRLEGAFAAGHQPSLDVLFPTAGQSSGGTRLVLTGDGFDQGLTVRIGGVIQSDVTVTEPTRVEVRTAGGLPGGPYLVELENPGGAIATGSFVYVQQSDPIASIASPEAGAAGGGDTISLEGSGFTAATEVVFGADPYTGAGGALAATVNLIDANTLSVVTPSHGAGFVSVLTTDATTGQAAVLVDAYSFTGGGGGGGGGGCGSVRGPRPPLGAREVLGGGWCWAALLLLFAARARRAAPVAARS